MKWKGNNTYTLNLLITIIIVEKIEYPLITEDVFFLKNDCLTQNVLSDSFVVKAF